MPISMKPSDIVTSDPVPLVDTFGHVESEVAAAYLLLAMKDGPDTFRPVTPAEVQDAIKAHVEHDHIHHNSKRKPGYTWLDNPFCRPDFDKLISDGFARCNSLAAGTRRPIAFTDKGIERLFNSRWRRR